MITLLNRVCLEKTAPETATYVYTDYARVATREKMRLCFTLSRSDTHDSCRMAFSGDNGVTWEDERILPVMEKTEAGVLRRHFRLGFSDPVADRFLWIYVEGLLRADDPRGDGIRNWRLRYGVSKDGGRTLLFDEPLVQDGPGYHAGHPLEGHYPGRNSAQIGDFTCRAIRTREGKILQPVQFTVLDEKGEIANPGGGYTWHESAVLLGTWQDDDRISWAISERVRIGAEDSTRGAVEPTLAQFPDGRILMLLRVSNDVRRTISGRRWAAVSRDGGKSWSKPSVWTYDDGVPFFSPSSCSLLLNHSSGQIFWIGNITPDNPAGNGPRYPLVMGRVCPEKLTLLRESVVVLDARGADDSEHLTLSNFSAHEDLVSGDVLLHLSRPFHLAQRNWTTDAYLYRIHVG